MSSSRASPSWMSTTCGEQRRGTAAASQGAPKSMHLTQCERHATKLWVDTFVGRRQRRTNAESIFFRYFFFHFTSERGVPVWLSKDSAMASEDRVGPWADKGWEAFRVASQIMVERWYVAPNEMHHPSP